MDSKTRKIRLEASSEKRSVMISSKDFVDLDTSKGLPFLKSVVLTKYSPKHFGMEKWESMFRIPDRMMRRIYKRNTYWDTEAPEPEPEVLELDQKRLLWAWMENHRKHYKVQSTDRVLRKNHPEDQLVEFFEKTQENCGYISPSSESSVALSDYDISADDVRSSFFTKTDAGTTSHHNRTSPDRPLIESKPENITKCFGHEIQPESSIVEVAIQKMKNLSPEKEKKYQDLLRDKEFMNFLNTSIEEYIKEDTSR